MVHFILAVEIVDGEFIFTIDEMVTQATARVYLQLLTVQATARVDVHQACESAGVNLSWSEMLPRRERERERDCVSAFASRDWTVVAKGAIRVRFHSLVFV